MPWTDDQEKALDVLMRVTCKVKPEGCGGPWCRARKLIADAFDVEVVLPPKAETPTKPDEGEESTE